jgi:cell division protein ZapD
MKMLRDSGMPHKVVATDGQFQQHLPAGRSFQLLRLRLDPALGLVPEISGNRLLFSVRLMQRSDDGRLQPALANMPLEVTLCA